MSGSGGREGGGGTRISRGGFAAQLVFNSFDGKTDTMLSYVGRKGREERRGRIMSPPRRDRQITLAVTQAVAAPAASRHRSPYRRPVALEEARTPPEQRWDRTPDPAEGARWRRGCAVAPAGSGGRGRG